MNKFNHIELATLTTGEISRYCGVHYRTVIRWIEQGELKAYQLPGRGDNRVTLEDFIAFLKTHQIPLPEALADTAGKPKRILIVEDDVALARSLQRILKSAGYETKHASDGFQAGTLLTTFKPHVMTLDIDMPGANGHDVMNFVKANKNLVPNTKILVVSGITKDELKKTTRLGADGVIQKPFDRDELLLQIKNLLN